MGREDVQSVGFQPRDIATEQARRVTDSPDVPQWRRDSQICDLLGAMMSDDFAESDPSPALLSSVALLSDLPEQGLFRGQLGVIVETLDDTTALVEFGDDQGRAYAIIPCSLDALLLLRTMPRAA